MKEKEIIEEIVYQNTVIIETNQEIINMLNQVLIVNEDGKIEKKTVRS